MKTPVLIELAIQVTLAAFAGKLRTGGELSIPRSTHSLRVGLMLLAWGYPIELCLGGFAHDFKEDTLLSEDYVKEMFGERTHFLMMACTLNPSLKADKEAAEKELYERVYALAKGGDLDPLRIKCADPLDNLRTNVCMKQDLQKHALFKSRRWHAAALEFFPDEMVTKELGHMIELEIARIGPES